MGALSRFLGTGPSEPAYPAEQEALICLKLSGDEMGSARERLAISALRDRLIRAVQAKDAGEFEDLQFVGGFGTLSFVGASADRLTEAVLPVIRTHDCAAGSYLLKRYGEPGLRDESVALGARG